LRLAANKAVQEYVPWMAVVAGLAFFLLAGLRWGSSTGLITLIPLVASGVVMMAISAASKLLSRRNSRVTLDDGAFSIRLVLDLLIKLLSRRAERNLRATLFLVDFTPSPPTLKQFVRVTQLGGVTTTATSMTVHQGVAGLAYRQEKTALFNVVGDPLSSALELGFTLEEARRFTTDIRSILCVPIHSELGAKIVGVLCLDDNTPKAFSPEDSELVEFMTPFISQILSKQSFERNYLSTSF
jgi:hypothetical protein